MLLDIFSKTWAKVSISARITHKRARHGVGGRYGNGRNADHAKKDTSRQNKTPQSGQEGTSEGDVI